MDGWKKEKKNWVEHQYNCSNTRNFGLKML